jgi:hypothetical protein
MRERKMPLSQRSGVPRSRARKYGKERSEGGREGRPVYGLSGSLTSRSDGSAADRRLEPTRLTRHR